MGITQVTAAVRNPANPDQAWEALFLVDTGEVDSLVPGKHLRQLGLSPQAQRHYELADGSPLTLDVCGAQIEFMGERVGTTVVFGDDDAQPVLGMIALASVGIELDKRSMRLIRRPTVRLKFAASAE